MIIAAYLASIICANLTIALVARLAPAWIGAATITIAFLLIGLDLTLRDRLHDLWQGRRLFPRMLILIGSGSALSYLLNRGAGPVALASFLAFLSAGLADTAAYHWLRGRPRLHRINGSNLVGAAIDSFVFLTVAFGWPPIWALVLAQFAAKVLGGLLWSLLIPRRQPMPQGIEP